MMVHRIFIAINLPEPLEAELLSYQEKWRALPCRWTAKENLHITLVFVGNTSDKELQEISRVLREIAKKHAPFSIELSKVSYGPSLKDPRMIWTEGKASKELLALQNDVEKELVNSSILHFVAEKRPWDLHVTLGRLHEFEFKKIEIEERPSVEQDLTISFRADSLEIMESKLKRSGAEYTVLQSFILKE